MRIKNYLLTFLVLIPSVGKTESLEPLDSHYGCIIASMLHAKRADHPTRAESKKLPPVTFPGISSLKDFGENYYQDLCVETGDYGPEVQFGKLLYQLSKP